MPKKLTNNEWWVYIIETSCQSFYTGITTDVARRFDEHLAMFRGEAQKGAKYFRGREPKKIVFKEACANRSEASQREYAIKQMSRQQKLRLIQPNS